MDKDWRANILLFIEIKKYPEARPKITGSDPFSPAN